VEKVFFKISNFIAGYFDSQSADYLFNKKPLFESGINEKFKLCSVSE